ncbi:palmitoyltransferase akr1, partial [Elasticomyces elasticus]
MSTSTTPSKSIPPSKSKQEEIELAQTQNGAQNGSAEPSLPLEEDIMQCARIGALEYVQAMIQSGKYKPTYADGEGITPLMWAAINNQYAVCKYLIEAGADINATGGESQATAVMWAAQ